MPGEVCGCGRTKKPFEKPGAPCFYCKQQARMGERPDDAPVPRVVQADRPDDVPVLVEAAAPAPVVVPVVVEAPKSPTCWRCGRLSGVRTKGAFVGLCKNCENGGRVACKRLGRPGTAENILRWCVDVPYGSDRARPVTPADESQPAASSAAPLRYIAGASVFVRSRELGRFRLPLDVRLLYQLRREVAA